MRRISYCYNASMEEEKPGLPPASNTDHDLEELPEPLRALMQQRLRGEPPGSGVPSGNGLNNDDRFPLPSEVLPLLTTLVKVLVKSGALIPPPPDESSARPAPQEPPPVPQPVPEPLKPVSSGWVIWLIAGVAIAWLYYYHGHSGALP